MIIKRLRCLTQFAVVILTGFLLLSCSSPDYAGKPESITFANLRLAASTLIYIAQDKHYFANNGLNVTIKENDTGVATTNALLKGEADIGTMAEFLMVTHILQKRKLSILGIMDKTMTIVLIGLKSHGITKVSDLAGKRIGLGKGTTAEFYLGRFLELNGMKVGDVVIIDTAPPKMLAGMTSGDLDAVVTWAPYTAQIEERFADQTRIWPVQSSQPVFGLIVAGSEWAAAHPETISRFWKSLDQAEQFLRKNPDGAKDILHQRLGYDRAYIDSIWPQYDFSLSLDTSLILAMEDEARWMIKNNRTTEKTVPNFMGYVNEAALKKVKPDAVNIIR